MLRLLQKKLPRGAACSTTATNLRFPHSSGPSGTPKIMKATAEAYSEGPTTLVQQGAFKFIIDEPPKLGGKGLGPNPLTHLLGSLMACTSYTLTMVTNELKLPLFNRATWSASGEYDLRGLQGIDNATDARFQSITLKGVVDTDASQEDLDKIRDQIEKRCIVAATLGASGMKMGFVLEKGQVDHDCKPACELHDIENKKGISGKIDGNPGSQADSPQFNGANGHGKAKSVASARGFHTQSGVFWAADGEDVAREHLDPDKKEPQVQKEQSQQGAEETKGGAYASRDSPRAQAGPPTEGKSDKQLVQEQTAGAKTHPDGRETGKSEEKGGSEPVTPPPGFAG
jgi:putative redox protein